MTDFNCKFKLQKGIITDVVLGGEVLTDWTTCLTNNFVPNFQNSKFMDVLETLAVSGNASLQKMYEFL